MKWHVFGAVGMMPFNIPTDPAMPQFLERIGKEIPGIVVHGPYRDYQAGQIGAEISALPAEDGVFYTGTSLSANDATVVAEYTHHVMDAILCFQASIYGVHVPVPANVKFAMLFNSDNPLPWPGLGAYRWERGEGMSGGLINHPHNIPHPGDYDLNDQATFITIMKRIIAHTQR